MTIEELGSLLVQDVAMIHYRLAEFREEVYAEGYAQGYDDHSEGKDPSFGGED